jgi:hypothetical protein
MVAELFFQDRPTFNIKFRLASYEFKKQIFFIQNFLLKDLKHLKKIKRGCFVIHVNVVYTRQINISATLCVNSSYFLLVFVYSCHFTFINLTVTNLR